jgi:hypothetical protein
MILRRCLFSAVHVPQSAKWYVYHIFSRSSIRIAASTPHLLRFVFPSNTSNYVNRLQHICPELRSGGKSSSTGTNEKIVRVNKVSCLLTCTRNKKTQISVLSSPVVRNDNDPSLRGGSQGLAAAAPAAAMAARAALKKRGPTPMRTPYPLCSHTANSSCG